MSTVPLIRARGIADCSRLLDQLDERLARPGEELLEQLLPGVLEIQSSWWGSLGRGTWDGHDLEETGALKAASTVEDAPGQKHEILGEDSLLFGIATGGDADRDAFYGLFLAARGWSPIVDPQDPDAEAIAEEFAIQLLESL